MAKPPRPQHRRDSSSFAHEVYVNMVGSLIASVLITSAIWGVDHRHAIYVAMQKSYRFAVGPPNSCSASEAIQQSFPRIPIGCLPAFMKCRDACGREIGPTGIGVGSIR